MRKTSILASLRITEEYWIKRIKAADIADHPTAKGDISENAWRGLLAEYLPARYRVNPGFVISADGGRSRQIDCIIYDNTYTPTFFSEHGLHYIPAEGVYAVLEIKQEVSKENILDACNKAKSVRSLRRTSAPYVWDGQERPPKPSLPIIGGLLANRINGWVPHSQTMASRQYLPKSKTDGGIDVILTASKGGADFFDRGRGLPARNPRIYPDAGGLMLGVLRLNHALQAQGTVPAVDWKDWLSKYKP